MPREKSSDSKSIRLPMIVYINYTLELQVCANAEVKTS